MGNWRVPAETTVNGISVKEGKETAKTTCPFSFGDERWPYKHIVRISYNDEPFF